MSHSKVSLKSLTAKCLNQNISLKNVSLKYIIQNVSLKMSHSFSFSHCITLISKSLHFSWCPCWFNRWRREVCSCFHCFCCFFKAAGSSVEIEAFPLFYYSRRRRRRHSFSFFGFGKALCLETTFAISQLLPTHQGNFRNLLSLASSFFVQIGNS